MKSIARFLLTIVCVNFLSFMPNAFALDPNEQKILGQAMATHKRKSSSGEADQQSRTQRQESLLEFPDWCTCGICGNEYDTTEHFPKGMMCGHTYCDSCLRSHANELSTRRKPMDCPNCRKIVGLQPAPNRDLLDAVLDYKRKFPAGHLSTQTSKRARVCATEECRKAVLNLCGSYIKEGQQRRCRGDISLGFGAFDWAIDVFRVIADFTPLSVADAKVGAWLRAHLAFLSIDSEYSDADVFFESALEYFTVQLEMARAAKNEELCRLTLIDILIIKLNYVGYKLLFDRIELNEAKKELDELEASLARTSPWHIAQVRKVQAFYFLMIRDFEKASALAKESIVLTRERAGAESCMWVLIRILADEMEQPGVIPSIELLTRYQAHDWKGTFDSLRKRTRMQGDVLEMMRVLFDLGRVAINVGLLEEAKDLMTRAIDVGTQSQAKFDKYAAEQKFAGLPNGFHFVLPKWIGLAKAAVDELARNPAEAQAAAVGDYESAALDNSQDQAEILIRTKIQQIKTQEARAKQAPVPLADAVFASDVDGLADCDKDKIRKFFEGI